MQYFSSLFFRIPFLRQCYTQYYTGYEAANTYLISQKMNNKPFAQKLKELEQKATQNKALQFSSCLIQPIQRVPKYQALIHVRLKIFVFTTIC